MAETVGFEPATRRLTAFGHDPDEIRLNDYSLSDEQRDIREAFGRFFAENSRSERVRAAEPLGFDAELWRLVAELGVVSLRLPVQRGGVGGSLVDLALIGEEAGRTAAPVVLAEACASAPLLALAEDEEAEQRLAAAAAGELVATVALAPLDRGSQQLLPAGAVATAIAALDGEDLVLFLPPAPAPHARNLGSAPLAIWSPRDSDRRLVLARGPRAVELHRRAVAEWRSITAAALVGAAKQAIDEAVEFAKTRLTSQVPIGALQGVSHPLADAEIRVAASRRLVWKAAWFHDNEPEARPELAAVAYVHADEAADLATRTALHMQGGFGFTLESDVTLYFCRARGWSVVGDPAVALAEVGERLAARPRSRAA